MSCTVANYNVTSYNIASYNVVSTIVAASRVVVLAFAIIATPHHRPWWPFVAPRYRLLEPLAAPRYWLPQQRTYRVMGYRVADWCNRSLAYVTVDVSVSIIVDIRFCRTFVESSFNFRPIVVPSYVVTS